MTEVDAILKSSLPKSPTAAVAKEVYVVVADPEALLLRVKTLVTGTVFEPVSRFQPRELEPDAVTYTCEIVNGLSAT